MCNFFLFFYLYIYYSYKIFFLDPPSVAAFPQQNTIERDDLSVTCNYTHGNPISTTLSWTKTDDPEFKHNEIILQLPKIERNSSGTYICTAENTYSNGEKGTDSQSLVVNVQCK